MTNCPRCHKEMKDNNGTEVYHNGTNFTLDGDFEKDTVQYVVGNDCAKRFVEELNK